MMYVRSDSRAPLLLAMPPAVSAFPARGSAIANSGEGRRRASSDLAIAPGRFCRCRPSGMGDAAGTAQGVQVAGSLSGPLITGLAASSASSQIAAGSTTAYILGIPATTAIPIIGAAIAGITVLATYLIKNSGCGQTCIETSQWANQAEALLAQNIQAYFSNPAPRSQSQQNAALANFDAIWARLTQMCSDPSTGDAGKRCISDRQAGACTWHQRADSPLLAYPGEPQAGECWNWFSGYRDPIANDPNVVPDSVGSIASSALSAAETLPSWVWLAALAVLAVAL